MVKKHLLKLILSLLIMTLFILAFSIDSKVKAEWFTYGDNIEYSKNGDNTIRIEYIIDKNIETLVIPEQIDGMNVVELGDSLFEDCINLKSITLPKYLERLEGEVFRNCQSLEVINFPANVYWIVDEGYSFVGCEKLREINVDENNKYFKSENGFLIEDEHQVHSGATNINDMTIITYPKGIEMAEIPDYVTKIGNYAFCGYDKIRNLKLSSNILAIGGEAFCECENLTSIDMSDCTFIGQYAFQLCTNLTKINLGNKLEYIGQGAFCYCEKLTNIKIPNSVTYIGYSAFEGCTSLKSIFIPKSVTEIEDVSAFAYCNDLTLYVEKDSYAETFAQENNLRYKYVDEYVDEEIETSIPEQKGDFYSTGKPFTGEYGYFYKDSYFDNDATTYNHNLATMSLCLAFSAYNATEDNSYINEDVNVKNLLKACGFTNYEQKNYNQKPTTDSIACAIASKSLEDSTLIAVAVRGGGYEAEWSSNMKAGTTGDHQGFDEASEKVYNYLMDYISNKSITGNVKIWITGFSRAGAVSNLLAAKLDRRSKNDTVTYNNKSVYAYCFATPAGAANINSPHDKMYKNIFSIINYHDPVPLVAPYYWDFDRYGITKVLPFSEGFANASEYENNMIKRLKNMGYTYEINDFKNVKAGPTIGYAVGYNVANAITGNDKGSMGTFLRKLISAMKGSNLLSTRENFVKNGMQEDLQNKFRDGSIDIKTEGVGILLSIIDRVAINKDISATAIKNKDILAIAHAEQAYYIAWMQSMDDNYVKNAKASFANYYRGIEVNCPVDVIVYDSNNKIVASIINEVPQEIEGSSIISSVDFDGQKVIYLPMDSEYRVETKARENCQTTYTIKEYGGTNFNVKRVINYNEIEMKKNEVLTSTVESYSEEDTENNFETGSTLDYIVKKSGKEIKKDVDISGNEIKEYIIKVEHKQNQGTATGGGIYTIGDFCQVTANNKEDYDFDGWYVEGKKVSNDRTYRFAVKTNTTLEAKFKVCTHSKTSNKVITKATLNKNGKIAYKCTICGKNLSTTIYYSKTISLSKTKFTYNKKVQKPAISVKDSNNKVLKEGTDYTVEYSNKKSKNVGQYQVTIIFKGNYSGTKKLKYTINPKGTSLKKLKKGKKSFKVTWKAQKTQTTGYEIQYATNKSFTSGKKTVNIKSNKTTSKKVTGLKKNKKYYVRIRTYKTVKIDGKNVKMYSGWSKVLNIKTK